MLLVGSLFCSVDLTFTSSSVRHEAGPCFRARFPNNQIFSPQAKKKKNSLIEYIYFVVIMFWYIDGKYEVHVF